MKRRKLEKYDSEEISWYERGKLGLWDLTREEDFQGERNTFNLVSFSACQGKYLQYKDISQTHPLPYYSPSRGSSRYRRAFGHR